MRFILIGFLVCLPLQAQNINTHFQRIYNVELGEDLSLHVQDENTLMNPTDNFTNQSWRVIPMSGESHHLSTALYGEEFTYEPREIDGVWRILRVDSGFFSGQQWRLDGDNEQGYKLHTEWLGPDLVLSVMRDAENNPMVVLAQDEDGSHQRWKFSDLLLLEHLPTITPPLFINSDHVWVSSPWTVSLNLPYPNSDGNDTFTSDGMFYKLIIKNKDDDSILFEEEIRSESWPVRQDYFVPFAGHEVRISRHGQNARFHESKAVVIDLQTPRGNDPAPSLTQNYDRWLLHLPKTSGGFDGLIELRNTQDWISFFTIVGFDSEGELVSQQTLGLGTKMVETKTLYGPDGLFGEDLKDRVSHLGVLEPSNTVKVSLLTTSRQTDFGVWTEAVDVVKGNASAPAFELSGTVPNEEYYMGMAVLNLNTPGGLDVIIDQLHPETFEVVETVEMDGFLWSGHKALFVLSTMFSENLPGARYRIRNSFNYPMQVFGLTGRLDGSFIGTARATPLPATEPIENKRNLHKDMPVIAPK